MSFTIAIEEPGVVSLVGYETIAEIYTSGALLNKFVFTHNNGHVYNCIDGLSHITEVPGNSWFKSAKMSPFVCRLSNAGFHFQDKAYKTGRSFSGVHAMHGLIYDAAFVIAGSDADEEHASVKLKYQWEGDSGFPFPYQVEVSYTLGLHNILTIQTELFNTGSLPMPCADGWHPYFNLQAPLDKCSIALHAVGKLKMSETLIPTGHITDTSPYNGVFSLKDLQLDDCFMLDENNTTCVLQGPYYHISIKALENYPYLQIFTPDHRQSIAVENLSSAPDAFNNGMGLIILESGQSKKFITSYHILPI